MYMLKALFRTTAAIFIAASFGLSAMPAPAATTEALASGVVSGANSAIRNAMEQRPTQPQTTLKDGLPAGSVAQVPPITQQPVGGAAAQGLPTGFTYFADLSVAYPFGNIGTFGKKWLQGGGDAMLAYGFNPQQRLFASYYELQHYPVGFNSGQVPLVLPSGFPTNGCVDLSGSGSATCPGIANPLDVTTKDRFLLFAFEQLITVGTMKGHPLPLVITPTYVMRWSTINQSGNHSDVVGFVDQNGVPHTDIHTRTAQFNALAFTAPFLKSPKFFGTLTLAPTVLSHLAGVNHENAVQLYEILYLEYNVSKNTRLFYEPQLSKDYLPADPYAQHLAAYFLGVTQRVSKEGFVQLVLNSGSPTNYSPYGVKYLQCFTLPCSKSTLPSVGGLKATQLQFQFGIGSPVVLPF
jgi:hypothetical protein